MSDNNPRVRAVAMARARYPGRPEVAAAISRRFDPIAGNAPMSLTMDARFFSSPLVADIHTDPEVLQGVAMAAFIDRVALELPVGVHPVVHPVESGLIEREFYPLDTLAARWRCTPNDIVHLGGMGAAQVCANIYTLASGVKMERLDCADPDDSGVDMPDGVFELAPETLRVLDLPGSFPFDLDDGFKYCRRSWWAYEFNPPVPIQQGHLCVLRAEVARLDAEVFSAVLGRRTGAQAAATSGEPAKTPAQQDQELKRVELVKRHSACWQTIERDLKDASHNGLRVAAGGETRGWWREGAALGWARARGKLIDSTAPRSFVFSMGRKKG